MGVVSCPFLEVLFSEFDTSVSTNWSLFGARRWSLSEVKFY